MRQLLELPEHKFDWPPTLKVVAGMRWKWNAHRRDGVGRAPAIWCIWEAFQNESNNVDVRLVEVPEEAKAWIAQITRSLMAR